MIKEKITQLIKADAFSKTGAFKSFLTNPDFTKRYSILMPDIPYPIGNGIYKSTFCFFFYYKSFLVETFFCELTGSGNELIDEKLNCYKYPCNDVNRASCWEWVDVA